VTRGRTTSGVERRQLKLANADGVPARRAVLRHANLFSAGLVQADLSGADQDKDHCDADRERIVLRPVTA
jgi:hypothetical protein